MRIAVLQFAPRLGEVSANMARADTLLAEAGLFGPGGDSAAGTAGPLPEKIDLLVLPEMAFSGASAPPSRRRPH